MAQGQSLVLPSGPVTGVVSAGTVSSLKVTLSGITTPANVVNGTYNAWCVDVNGDLLQSDAYTLYNTYGTLPTNVLQNGQAAWNEVNWLINNKTGHNGDEPSASANELQNAIWTLVDPYYGAGPNDAVTNQLVLDAQTYGASFVPAPGQLLAVLLYVDGIQSTTTNNFQDLLLEVQLGGSIGDYVWNDTNHNGIQDSSEQGINGVTVYLYKGTTLVATTTTSAAPSGYAYSGPNPNGYYQFTGLAPATYTVVIPVAQAALTGLEPTLSFQGTNIQVDSNGQLGTVPGTSTQAETATVTLPNNDQAPSSLIDETIDFGFYPVAAISLICPASTGTVGTLYSADLIASGGVMPYTYSISGSLPSGLTLNGNVISGTPTASGTFNFTGKVADSSGLAAGTTTSSCSIKVSSPPAINFTCPAVSGTVGTYLSSQISASGGAGTLTFSVGSGSLPGGLTLSGSGLISGTPTAAGTFTFSIKVVDSYGDTASSSCPSSCSITIASAPPMTLSCSSLTGGSGSTAWDASSFNVLALGVLSGNSYGKPALTGSLTTNSDIEGRVATSGFLNMPGPIGNGILDKTSELYTLIVGGNVESNNPINVKGRAYVAGTFKGQNGPLVQPTVGSVVTPPTTSDFNFTSARTSLENYSVNTLAKYSGATTVTPVGNGSFNVLTVSKAGLNVLNMNVSYLQNANLPLEVNVTNSSATVIINVTGAGASGNVNLIGVQYAVNGVQVGNLDTPGIPVLLNLPEATSLTFQRVVYGSILAPFATISTNSNITGNIIVGAVNYLGEIHDACFNGVGIPAIQ